MKPDTCLFISVTFSSESMNFELFLLLLLYISAKGARAVMQDNTIPYQVTQQKAFCVVMP
jgi:hypothetical protein